MTNIHVVFPEEGAPIVIHEDEALCERQQVYWHVRADNPQVEQVKIYFKDANNDQFFPEQPNKHECTKKLEKRGKRLHGKVYGTAPNLPAKGNHRKHKYTVEGLDKQGNPFDPPILLDPQIVSVRP